jgi:N-alpha-acetyltransferase 15/16, NatA auxiliary subunit
VLKRAGDPFGAAHALEEARTLDGQDRFLNSKAAKYFMRAGDMERAIQLLGLFTKVRTIGGGNSLTLPTQICDGYWLI